MSNPLPGRSDQSGACHEAPEGAVQDRRQFIKDGFVAAGSLSFGLDRIATGGGNRHRRGGGRRRHRHHRRTAPKRQPNILVILVDQMRTPLWMPRSATLKSVMPHLAALREKSVSFQRHYTASNACSPARGVLLTGLYSHQTGVMITGGSWLDPKFPTWGKLLRQMGYLTAYYGKWHLNPNPRAPLEQYGFEGGTYPSPNGGPGQGTRKDPAIARQLIEWLHHNAGQTPWCATASFVNPHDVAWWHRFTEEIPAEAFPPSRATAMPPNYETPAQLVAKGKPLLQQALQETAARSFGAVPFEGPGAYTAWTGLMNTYLLLQSYVDAQIGRVLSALASHPKVAANTVVIFTSDHGEYAGSHGMRGKGASAYEEAIRVPFYIHDPRGHLTVAPGMPRTGLTSSADLVPLLLTIAAGSSSWREDPAFSHLATRHDLAAMASHPHAPGRPWVVHATDEDVTEFAPKPYTAEAPRHVVALRTPTAKLALYSHWKPSSIQSVAQGRESELYDYATEEGKLELTPVAPGSALEEEMASLLLETAIPHELQAPLPTRLRRAHRQGMADYHAVDGFQAEKAYEDRHGGREPKPEPL